ncbi:MAG: DUF932 domain-containing protein [Gemmataceae bacterium]
MADLARASRELFRRAPDEYVSDLAALAARCREQRERSQDRWQLPQTIRPVVAAGRVGVELGSDGAFELNDWSFSQLCRFAAVAKDTVNKLSAETAAKALAETLPVAKRPTQVLTEGTRVRSVHGTNYERLWNSELLAVVQEFATDFMEPPRGFNGATGLYLGEQDLFCFLIDPTGWVEVEKEAFAPGLFVWNSEVGRRTVGVSTFWMQGVCGNHLIHGSRDAVETEWKHTGKVSEALKGIRRAIEVTVQKRDERKDDFARLIRKAMEERLAEDAEEAMKALAQHGVLQRLAKEAVNLTLEAGKRFTLFNLVDALTRIAREIPYAGDRAEADEKASRLLSLAR